MRTVVTRDVEWDRDEQALMLALDLYEAQLLGCGHYRPHATAEDAEGAYRVPPPTRCHICTIIAAARDAYRGSDHPEALHFFPERR